MIDDKTPKIYLSRRNLLALLSKLDAEAAGEETSCMIIKKQPASPEYRQTMATIAVIAVDDEAFYGSQQRAAGEMHPREEEKLAKPSTGVEFGGDLLAGPLVFVEIRQTNDEEVREWPGRW